MPLLRSATKLQAGDTVVILNYRPSWFSLRLLPYKYEDHKQKGMLYFSYSCGFKYIADTGCVYSNSVFGVLNGKPPVDHYEGERLLKRIAFNYRDLIRRRMCEDI